MKVILTVAFVSLLLVCECLGKSISSSDGELTEDARNVEVTLPSLDESPHTSGPKTAERRNHVPDSAPKREAERKQSSGSQARPRDARPRLLFDNPLADLMLLPFGGLFSQQPQPAYPFHQPSHYREQPSNKGPQGPGGRPYPVRTSANPQQATPTSGDFFTNGFSLMNDLVGQMHPDPRVSEGARQRMFDRFGNGFRTVENFLSRSGGNPRDEYASLYRQFHRQQAHPSQNRPRGMFDFIFEPFYALIRTFFPWIPSSANQATTSSQGSPYSIFPFIFGGRPAHQSEDDVDDDEDEELLQPAGHSVLPKTGFRLSSQHVASNGPPGQVVQNVLDEVPPRQNEINDVRRNVNRVRPDWDPIDGESRHEIRRPPSAGSIRNQFPPARNRV